MPVPAGIRCPMMMFSFRPSRSSLAPRIAASVNTRVVSWKEAAEMNDCVVRLAFVMPSSSGSRAEGLPPLALLRMHPDLALAALDLAEPHHAVHFRNRGRVLRPTRLEQLGDARQTARDVARLVRLARHLGKHLARIDL